MLEFELNFLELLEKTRSVFLNNFFEIITMPGEETLIVILLAILYFMYDKEAAKRIFYITVTSLSVNNIIKNFFKVPRPFSTGKITCVRPETATGYSFPSGHTQNTATWTSAFAIKYKKRWMIAGSIVLTLAVGFSRLYLGAHYPSDVIAGIILGLTISFFGSVIYDRIKNKNMLYVSTVLIMTPFAVYFLFGADPLYEDFYKIYGLLAGLAISSPFEEKYVSFDYAISKPKKILRVIISVVIALITKEISKGFLPTQTLSIELIGEAVRYFLLVFIVFGILPFFFKKFKM